MFNYITNINNILSSILNLSLYPYFSAWSTCNLSIPEFVLTSYDLLQATLKTPAVDIENLDMCWLVAKFEYSIFLSFWMFNVFYLKFTMIKIEIN